VQFQSYASDMLEDAMILAQTKAINSFSFRDTINSVSELWRYCYEKMAQIDSGFYSKTVRLTGGLNGEPKLTRIPPHVMGSLRVYSARGPVGFSRRVYKQSGQNDMNSPRTFHISGNDVYCWDTDLTWVWCEYMPEPPFITFTKNNRDPKIFREAPQAEYTQRNYGMFRLWGAYNGATAMTSAEVIARLNDLAVPITFMNRSTLEVIDRTVAFRREGFEIVAFILDHPWCFITFRNIITDEHESFVTQGVIEDIEHTRYNPFDYQGRGSNVQYLTAKYNDYTGMGVVILDYSDGQCKELGWTPDTLMRYPSRIMYNYMVATLAQRFAALNGSTIMAVEIALAQAQDEMGLWLKKNKSAWMRADNVTGPMLMDFL